MQGSGTISLGDPFTQQDSLSNLDRHATNDTIEIGPPGKKPRDSPWQFALPVETEQGQSAPSTAEEHVVTIANNLSSSNASNASIDTASRRATATNGAGSNHLGPRAEATPISSGATLRSDTRPDKDHAPVRTALGRSFGKWLALGTMGVVLLVVGGPLLSMLVNRFNPLAVRTVDRSGPTLLTAISDMHTYQAASGEFQVVVDIEKDAKWLPSAIRGERVVLLAQGSVDAGVDLGAIGPRSIATDPKTGAVTITIPHATLGEAHVDLKASTVVRHDRGLFDRLGSTFGDASQTDNNAFVLAEAKLHKAAVDSKLLDKAETNTAQMLRQLVTGLGHNQVTVHFTDGPVLSGPPAL